MFFYLSKILHFLLSPVTWVLVLLVVSLLLKNGKKARRVLVSAVCILFVFSNSYITGEFVRLSETPMVSMNNLQKYDAAIVLGGGMVTIDRENNRLIFQQNTDRVMQAILLYKRGIVRKLLLSSGSGSIVFDDMREASLLKNYMTETGISGTDVMVDSVSRNTNENAVNTAKLINDSLPGGKFLLITSALHMHRAKACFEKQGIKVDVFPASKIASSQRRWDVGYLMVPNTENLLMWEKLLHEWFGYIIYWIAGYI